jgi:5-methylthioribose kinase
MSRFQRHFRMTESDAIEYALEKTGFFTPDADLVCDEIGDGNMNYVFRVQDRQNGRSVIIKHADTSVRIKSVDISTDRARIEAEALMLQGRLAPGLVPKVYLYDPIMCCIVMEDLIGYQNMRYALIERKTFPSFVEDITTFMAETLIRTTDNILPPTQKKALAGKFINPELCDVSERLVYTNPYTDNEGCNIIHSPNKEFLERELYRDIALHLEVAKLKDQFKNKAQALIHGDLHTGSILIKTDSTKVIDPEFAFFGPIGYDVGNLVANLIFAWANARATMMPGPEQDEFLDFLEKSIRSVVDLFRQKAMDILTNYTTDVMAKTTGFAQWYVDDILTDCAGVTGLELNRRIIGKAKVKDIAGIEDSAQRTLAERICVLSGKACIMKRKTGYRSGEDYVREINAAAAAALTHQN